MRNRRGRSTRPERPWTERHHDGSTTIHMDDRMVEIVEGQLQAFRDKFGREPGPHDPVFFDPDADTPQKVPLATHHAIMLDGLRKAGAPPEIIYAFEKTDRIVLSDRRHMLTPDELAEWDAAVAEGRELHHQRKYKRRRPETAEVFGRDQWTTAEVNELLLDPRAVGVGDFPPIIDEATWIGAQVKLIAEMGPEAYAKGQLDTLKGAFSGYADMLAEHLGESPDPEGMADPRSTEEIRADYLRGKAENADDPLVVDVCDAGLALLDAEVALHEAPLGTRTKARRAVEAARNRMDAAMQANEVSKKQ